MTALWGTMSPKGPSCFQGTLAELLEHEIVSTTMIYTHILNRGGLGVNSPPLIAYKVAEIGRRRWQRLLAG